MRLEFSRGTTIAAETGQAVVDMKLEVKLELVRTHDPCYGMGSNRQRYQSERLTYHYAISIEKATTILFATDRDV